jgi:4-hydroxy-tetrahydrodipicolinate synthase
MANYGPGGARKWVRENFSGYFTVLYTPFLAQGEIDEAGLRRNVEITLSLPGVGGLSLHSVHQEFWTLTDAERKRVTEIVLEAVGGRKPVIVGVSDTAARNVVDFARHAAAAGADAVMVWPPYYGPKSAAGITAFYEYVAARIDIGMFVYSTTLSELGFYLTPEAVGSLLHLDNLCGVHSSTMNFASYAAMLERVGGELCVSTSLEEYFLFGRLAFPGTAPDFMMGSSRPLLVQNHEQPRCGRFIEAALRGDAAEAGLAVREIVRVAEKLQSRYFAQGFHHVALFKQLSTHLGLAAGPVRPPLSAPSAAELDECLAAMAQAGLLPARQAGAP